jgi:hypothetical protein
MTHDEIIEMARQVGVGATGNEYYPFFIEELEAFARLVAAKELEACAKLIEEMPCDCCWPENSISLAEDFADAIRARGEQA